MKKIVKLLSIVAITSVMTTSCIKDDAGNSSNNNNGNNNGGNNTNTFTVDANNFKGDIKGNVSLDANKTYKLTGPLVILDGGTLTIPEGVKISATGGTSAYIVVSQGGKINVNGKATNPVVMTSGEAKPAPGDWGGLVICGRAPINSATSASAEVSGLTYGGTVSNDDSGSLKYLRIEYSGAIYNANKEFNGLSLFGVGSGTSIEYVQVYRSSDDGYEFFGGTVNTNYLVSTYNEDDQFDWTEGWSGTNTNWYGKLGNNIGNRGIEADNLEANFEATPIANPSITNLTLIGISDGVYTGVEQDALKLRRGTKVNLSNVFLEGFTTGFNVEHDQTIAFIGTGALKATNVKFTNITNPSKGKNTAGASVNVSTMYTESATATGAGNGAGAPAWAAGWTVGL